MANSAQWPNCFETLCVKPYMGVDAILRQKLTATPKTYAKKFGLSPRIGAKCQWAMVEAKQRLKEWGQAYRAAWEEWRGGNREVVFPFGTYAMVRYSGVPCDAC